MTSLSVRCLAALVLLTPLIGLLSCGGMGDGFAQDDEVRWARRRDRMVQSQLASRDIEDKCVLDAMRRVPRHQFLPPKAVDLAYEDRAVPINHGQTMSQPYIVALMTQLAEPKLSDRALDIGTGSGYQAAVLASLVKDVHSIEIVPELADEARERLRSLGYANVAVRQGDGYQGLKEHAPYDIIVLAAAPPEVPPALIEQLAPNGRLILPVGEQSKSQHLIMIRKHMDGSLHRKAIAPVAFVPMTGQAQSKIDER